MFLIKGKLNLVKANSILKNSRSIKYAETSIEYESKYRSLKGIIEILNFPTTAFII